MTILRRITWEQMQADMAELRKLAWAAFVRSHPATVESLQTRLAEFQQRLDAAKQRIKRNARS